MSSNYHHHYINGLGRQWSRTYHPLSINNKPSHDIDVDDWDIFKNRGWRNEPRDLKTEVIEWLQWDTEEEWTTFTIGHPSRFWVSFENEGDALRFALTFCS